MPMEPSNPIPIPRLWMRAKTSHPRLARGWATLQGWSAWAFRRDQSAELMECLRLAFPDLSGSALERICRRWWITQKQLGIDQTRLEYLEDDSIHALLDAHVRVQNAEVLQRAQAEGNPVILVSPHFGNYMLGALKLARQNVQNGVYFFFNPPERNPYASTANRLLERPGLRCHTIYNNQAGLLKAMKVLKRGGMVCIMPDLISVTSTTLYVPFFGRFFGATAGAAFLALKSKAHVVPAYCYPDGPGSYVLEFEEPLRANDGSHFSFEDQVFDLTSKIFKNIETHARIHPECWKYWHILPRRMVHFLKPSEDPAGLLVELETYGQKVHQDQGLAGFVRDLGQILEPSLSQTPV